MNKVEYNKYKMRSKCKAIKCKIKCVRCMDGVIRSSSMRRPCTWANFSPSNCNWQHTDIRAMEKSEPRLKGLFWEGSFEGQVKADGKLFPQRKSNGTLRENSLHLCILMTIHLFTLLVPFCLCQRSQLLQCLMAV